MSEYNIKAVLFDLEGTLLDTHDLILLSMRHATTTVLGKDIPQEILMAKVGQPLDVQMASLTDDVLLQEELLTVYRQHNAIHHDAMVQPFIGVGSTLRALSEAGYTLGVVTSKRHELAMHGLRLFGLDIYMACVVGADDCVFHKPDPGPVLHAIDLLGFAPEACVYAGDSPFDLQAGEQAGCSTIGALWGMFSESVLRAENPDCVCSDIREIPILLEVNNSQQIQKI